MNKYFIISLCIWAVSMLYSTDLKAQTGENLVTLSGVIEEADTKERVISAIIKLKGTDYYAISGLDGSFIIRNIRAGNYVMEVTYVGLVTYEKSISLFQNMRLNVDLKQETFFTETATVVTKRDQTTDESARKDEKNADNALNIISGKSIDLSPDLTVANITQRVSGVSLERNANGDGQHAVVRGMDKRYNYTLVNGIKIPSPDPKNRYVPLDIFPADLLDRLVVTKSLLPNMEGDAIGGVIDMKMKDAPAKFTLNLNLGMGYNTMFEQRPFQEFDRSTVNTKSPHGTNGRDYRATIADFPYENLMLEDVKRPLNSLYSLSIGNRLFNNKLGIIVAASYQNTFRGANSMFMSTFIDQATNLPYYEIMQKREFSTEQVRGGLHTKLDYKFNARHKVSLYAAYVDLQARENRSRIDTILKIGRGQGPGTGRVELRERTRQEIQRIYNATLQGDHVFSKIFSANWSLVSSLATNDDPDMAEVKWLTGVVKNTTTGELEYEPILYDRDYTRRWINNFDNDLSVYYNFIVEPVKKLEFSAGGMGRFKTRQSEFNSYLFRTSPIRQEWSGDVRDYTFNLFNNIGTPTDPLNYSSNETILANYVMGKYTTDRLQVIGGLRVENTSFSWESNAPATLDGRTGTREYIDVLPSVHLKLMPNTKTNVRASYFSSISRPSFFEVIPYDLNEDDFRERGNPFLERTQANNYDARFEYFPTSVDQFMAGFFYKQIMNPIESALAIRGQTIFLQPNNFGTATNMGFEFDVTKYFNEFGIRAFYTLTLSEITTSKIVRFRDDQGNLTSRETMQTRPLQGQSKHISNVAVLYKRQEIGLDMQLAMVYTGDRIISVSPYLDNDIWQRGFVQLDLSVEKRFAKKFAVYLKINNLLNTPLLADIRLPNTFNPEQAPYLDSSESVLVREDFYWQTITFGVKYKI